MLATWQEFIDACIPSPATVSVQPWLGSNAYGDTHGPAEDFGPCYIEAVQRTVVVQTVEQQGREALSSTTVFGPFEPEIRAGSLVVAPGRDTAARVLAVARHYDHGVGVPSHQELNLE